ncbi:MAG: response regulator [Anaerolineae bacterium]|nr:response regulator [Anaerolineae bacterium]
MPQVVLLVEDDSDLRRLYKRVFETAGFDTLEAGNGAQAIDALKKERPDAVLLDIAMPEVSGTVVIDHIRGKLKWADMPIIVITAYPYFLESAAAAGATHTLLKPVEMDQVVQIIREAIRK